MIFKKWRIKIDDEVFGELTEDFGCLTREFVLNFGNIS